MPNQQICTPVNTSNSTTTSISVSLLLRQGSHCIAMVGLKLIHRPRWPQLWSPSCFCLCGAWMTSVSQHSWLHLLGFVIYIWLNEQRPSYVSCGNHSNWRISKCKALAKFLWTLKFKFHIMLMCQEYYSFVFDWILYPIDHSFQLLLK